MSECFIVSLKHTKADDLYVSLWRPKNCGYCYPLPWAGRYPTELVLAKLNYYNDGINTVAVPCEVVEGLTIAKPEPGYVDGDTGPVVPNCEHSWEAIHEARIDPAEGVFA